MNFEKRLEEFNQEHFHALNFSLASFAKIDFNDFSFQVKSFYLPTLQKTDNNIYFDLASLTKPLTMGLASLSFNLSSDLKLLASHRAGLPAFGALSKNNWKSHLKQFEIRDSETLYSDYSALRFMLEFDREQSMTLEKLCTDFYGTDLRYWLSLTEEEKGNSVITGTRGKNLIQGDVHDPNTYNLKTFCSHAGYFAYHQGLCSALIKLEKKFKLTSEIKERLNETRFSDGFDRVQDLENTLAGKGATNSTFGHLGFTGTCFWIDPDKKIGWSLLTNATEFYWFDRRYLNALRRFYGEWIWSGNCIN